MPLKMEIIFLCLVDNHYCRCTLSMEDTDHKMLEKYNHRVDMFQTFYTFQSFIHQQDEYPCYLLQAELLSFKPAGCILRKNLSVFND